MSHQFLQKLLVSFFIIGQVSNTWSSYNQGSSLLNQFEESINSSKQFIDSQNSSKETSHFIKDIEKIKDIELTQKQLSSLLFLSPENTFHLFLTNSCALYVYLKEDINFLKITNLQNLEAKITYNNNEEKNITIPKEIFSDLFFKFNCLKQKDYFSLTTKEKIKSYIASKKIQIPDSEKSCYAEISKWKNDPSLPHLCSVISKIELASDLKERLEDPRLKLSERSKINSLVRTSSAYQQEIETVDYLFFKNFCSNISSPQKICKSYNITDFWKLIENGTQSLTKLKFKCQHLVGKKDIEIKDLKDCISIVRTKDSICSFKGNIDNQSLTPMPLCSDISSALLAGKLKTTYQDCPVNIENSSIITIYRVLKHFGKVKEQLNVDDCIFPSYASVYEIYLDAKEINKWPLKICPKPSLAQGSQCYPFVPGNHKDYTYSQNNVVSDLLYNFKVTNNKYSCEVIQEKLYKPDRLKYRSGCWILASSKICAENKCDIKILIDGNIVDSFYSTGNINIPFEKVKYNDINASLLDRIENTYQLKSQEISSLTSAKFFLESKRNGIIIGQGCLEELYPEFYKNRSSSSCSLTSYIIDGVIEKNGKSFLTIRTSIDDVHSPRIISWNNLLNSLFKFKTIHPLKPWSLHGIN